MSNNIRKIYDITEIPKRNELQERFMFPFSQLNFLLNGGMLDRVTLITSQTNQGKTTITSQIIEDVINQGYKVCCFFGEDTPYESQDRLYKQVLKSNTKAVKYVPYYVNGKETNCGDYVIDDEFYDKAQAKFKCKMFLYNTKAKASVDEILEGFEQARVEKGCRVFVLDNVDQFEFSSDNENKAIKDCVIKIRDYAINNKVHIFLISHIRKLERDVIMPNLNDVKGTSALVNIAKNVVIVLRTDVMDKSSKGYKALKDLVEQNGYNLDECDSLLYVAKTKGRKLGFVGLKYNKVTNTYYEPQVDNRQKIENTEPKIQLQQKKVDLTNFSFDNLEEVETEDGLPF